MLAGCTGFGASSPLSGITLESRIPNVLSTQGNPLKVLRSQGVSSFSTSPDPRNHEYQKHVKPTEPLYMESKVVYLRDILSNGIPYRSYLKRVAI